MYECCPAPAALSARFAALPPIITHEITALTRAGPAQISITTPPCPTREQEHDQDKWREGCAGRRRRVSLHLNQVEGQEAGRPAQSSVQEEREQNGADRLTAPLFIKRCADDRQAAGNEERAADPLHRTCDDELSNSRRQAAPDRRERKEMRQSLKKPFTRRVAQSLLNNGRETVPVLRQRVGLLDTDSYDW